MPQSKYGGIPVEDEQPKAGSKYGGIRVDEAPVAQKPAMAEAQPQTFGHGITEFAKQINPVPMITGAASAIAHPLDTARNIYSAQANEFSQVPKLVREGRYSEAVGHGAAGLVPMLGPAAAKIGETIGGTETQFDKYGTVIKPGQPPDPAGGIGAGAGLVTSIAAAPAVSKSAGRMIKGIAPPLVKSALGLPGKAEAYGANPAAAVLEDTKGIRPSTIAESGQRKITELSKDLDTAASKSTATPSLKPARDILNRESVSAAASNSEQAPREIGRMSRQLTDIRPGFTGRTEYPINSDVTGLYSPTELPFAKGPHTPVSFSRTAPHRPVSGGLTMENIPPGPPATPRLIRGLTHEAGSPEFARGPYTPITVQPSDITDELGRKSITGTPRIIRGKTPGAVVAAEQPARQFLGMKRQFDNDFISNWNPSSDTKHGLGVARQAYGAMSDELNRTVPGAEQLNNRMQGLIPAVKRAEDVSRNAGVMQKAMDRISRPTGALVPALIGKQMGGIPGLLAGLGVPEMISAPAVKMLGARSLYGTGKLLRSPVGQRLIQAPTLFRQNQ